MRREMCSHGVMYVRGSDSIDYQVALLDETAPSFKSLPRFVVQYFSMLMRMTSNGQPFS